MEVDPTDSQEAAQSLADSDAESERAAPTPGSNEPVEPTSAPAKREKGKKQPAKATAVKRRPASSNVSSAPASKRRRNFFSLVMWTDGRGRQNNAVSVRVVVGHSSSFAHSTRLGRQFEMWRWGREMRISVFQLRVKGFNGANQSMAVMYATPQVI